MRLLCRAGSAMPHNNAAKFNAPVLRHALEAGNVETGLNVLAETCDTIYTLVAPVADVPGRRRQPRLRRHWLGSGMSDEIVVH